MHFLLKKLGSVLLGGSIVLSGSFSVMGAVSFASVSTDVLNIRSAASTDADVVGKAYMGDTIEVVGMDGEWFMIDRSGETAFVTAEFVEISQVAAIISSDGVNIRSGPSTEYRVLGALNAGDNVVVTGQCDEFYAVSYNGDAAYIHKDFIIGNYLEHLQEVSYTTPSSSSSSTPLSSSSSTPSSSSSSSASSAASSASSQAETTYVLITSSNGVNIRASASVDGDVLGAIPGNGAADIVEMGPEWHKVSYNGVAGYVKAEFSEVKTGVKPTSSSTLAQSVVDYAKQYIGTPYVYGSSNLNKGTDCSGFTYSVYKNFGISLNRSSRDQASDGTKISSKSSLQVADLVFFDTTGSNDGNISHVGIYIGNGQFIHSSSGSAYSVTISGLEDSYYSGRFVSAARVIG